MNKKSSDLDLDAEIPDAHMPLPASQEPADDALSGLVEDAETEIGQVVLETSQRPFKPWHRPRKHYLRIHQWCAEIQRLLPNLKLTGRSLSYLSLPGDDMLDVRAIHGVCAKKDIPLRYLGFNNASPNHRDEATLSHNELRSQGWKMIDRQASNVVYDYFEATANTSSTAYKELLNRAPYDVVNIDLCNCIAGPTKGRNFNTFDALKVLIDLQQNYRSEPWLLLLTTRTAQGDGVDKALWGKLCAVFDANLRGTLFQKSCRDSLGFTDEKSLSDVLEQDPFSKSFVVALGKWLLHVADSAWEITLRAPAFAYSVDGYSGLDMVSLAFGFSRRTPRLSDNSGLSKANAKLPPPRPEADEEQQACRLVSVVSTISDVDTLLSTDNELRAKVLRQSEDLMKQARYDVSRFQAWVEQGCPIVGSARDSTSS